MNEMYPHWFSFILPMVCTNLLHMVVVRLRIWEFLAEPISAQQFGSGKTWRGFIVLTILGGVFEWLFSFAYNSLNISVAQYFALGSLRGFCYALGELPNSYIKRRLGIAQGESGKSSKWLQYFIDKSDSLLCLLIVYYLITGVSLKVIALLFVVSFCIHVCFSALLVAFKIKKNF